MADLTLGFAACAVRHEPPQVNNPHLWKLWEILDQAASTHSPGMTRWFAYLEAALHMSERLLGAQVTRTNLHSPLKIEALRSRGRPCGAYATPHFIVEAVLKDVFSSVTNDRCVSMLDLSVEAGHFPVGVVAQAPPGLSTNFYAIDRDPIALRLTRRLFGFAERQSSGGGDHNLRLSCRDSLLDPLPIDWPREFDVIVGNPPWAGSRNAYNRSIKANFSPLLTRNFDLYLAFILRASQYLRPGGILAFVVPSTLLFNDSAHGTREHILENYDILSLRLFPRRSFIEVPCLIPISLVLSKKNPMQPRAPQTLIEYYPHKLGGEFRPRTRIFSPAAEYWRSKPKKCFHPLVGSQYESYLKYFKPLARLEELGLVLGAAKLEVVGTVKLKTAFRGFHARDLRSFHACRKTCTCYRANGYYFQAAPQREHLAARKVAFQNFRYMTHEKRLIAASIGPGEYGVSTAAQYIPYEQDLTDFYTALMNSAVINSWFKLGDVSRSIKLALVRDIPVALDPGLISEISGASRRCHIARTMLHERLDRCNTSEQCILLGDSTAEAWRELGEARQRIENHFFDLYRLSKKQRTLAQEISLRRVF